MADAAARQQQYEYKAVSDEFHAFYSNDFNRFPRRIQTWCYKRMFA